MTISMLCVCNSSGNMLPMYMVEGSLMLSSSPCTGCIKTLMGGIGIRSFVQHELRWIYYLRVMTSPGLNEAVNFKQFIEGFVSGKPKIEHIQG